VWLILYTQVNAMVISTNFNYFLFENTLFTFVIYTYVGIIDEFIFLQSMY
jgi:hypothetical protein